MQRWFKPSKCPAGSPQGLSRLPNEERKELYAQLKPLVGASWAGVLRDWRSTKIILFLENSVLEED